MKGNYVVTYLIFMVVGATKNIRKAHQTYMYVTSPRAIIVNTDQYINNAVTYLTFMEE